MILAPSTSVTVSSNVVRVTGEVYFAVTPRVTRPFTVQTGNAILNVLGTHFSVRQYPGDNTSRVVVEDGRVSLRSVDGAQQRSMQRNTRYNAQYNRAVIMSARTLAIVTDSNVRVTSEISPREYVAWVQGVLVFNQIELHTVIADLGRAYNVDIRVADTMLAKRKLHLDVSLADDPIGLILDQICEVTKAHYTYHGQSILLAPGRSATKPSDRGLKRYQYPQPERQYGK
jgi:ferric-dicitrate binding protein FerR (iron transport regulator)